MTKDELIEDIKKDIAKSHSREKYLVAAYHSKEGEIRAQLYATLTNLLKR